MPMTLDELQAYVRAQDLKYFIDPDRDVLMLGVRGVHATYRFVIALQAEGRFLQFRTVEYMHCPPDHPNLTAVLKTLAAINLEKRLVKFAWDASDGEVVVFADAWLEDGKVTQKQFERMVQNYMPTVDMGYSRIKTAMDTGSDPGEADLLERLGAAAGDLPPELRALLDKLRGGGKKGDDDDEEPGASGFETI